MFGVVSEQAFREAVLIALEQKNRSIYEAALALLSLHHNAHHNPHDVRGYRNLATDPGRRYTTTR